ncbi:MAG: hypothetical protein WB709_06950 [Solirubrobacteraceae bacterium]
MGTTFLASAVAPKFVTKSGKEFNCSDAAYHGVFLSPTLGDVLIRFLGCTAKEGLTVNCNTAGAGTGEVHLPLATLFHLGLAQLGTTAHIPALVFLLKSLTIKCTALVTIELQGSLIGALQKVNGEQVELGKPLSEVNLNFQQTSNGVQDLRLIVMPGGTTPTTYDLETSFNKGAFELESEVANARFDGFSSGGTEQEIEFVEP